MDTERWRQIEEVFQAAAECEPHNRSRLLEDSCRTDPELRAEVDALLASVDHSEDFLLDGIQREAERVTAKHATEVIGRRIGPYRITAVLGRGGMGSVYLAVRDDDVYQKQVAIKLIRRGMDTDDVLGRFRAERQILARLEHPNIARLIDGGATEEGLPYLVMEYVEGSPITEFCTARSLPLNEKLRLFRSTCDAVQYAHRHLVIHRDLKPQNILVSEDGIPKLLDFGVAKLLSEEEGARTVTGMRMLSPHYASPEQVEGAPVSTATDVYSLGIVLYEVITNNAPFRLTGQSATALELAIREQVPRPPSAVANTPKDLDNIVLKAIQKEPARRYLSVEQFSEDIRRYLEGLPVLARKDSPWYRAGKFVRRNRLAVAGATLAVLGLVAGTVVATAQAGRAERRFEQVRGLTNLVIHDLGRDLQSVPGTLSIQQRLVPKTIATLDALVKDSVDDPSLRTDLAMGYYRMANIQYSLDKPNSAEIEKGLGNLRQAVGILEPLLAREPGNRVLRGDLGRVYAQLGWCFLGMGDYEEAVNAHRRAIPLLQSAEPFSESNWPQFPSRLQKFNIARSLEYLGRYREALGTLEGGPNISFLTKLYTARVLAGQGDLHAAAQLVQGLKPPKQFPYLTTLFLGDLLGNPLQLNMGERVTGLGLIRDAVAIAERHASLDSRDMFARMNTSPTLHSLGAYTRETEPQESVNAYQRVIAVQNEQLKLSPHNRAARRLIASAHAEMALPLRKLGRAADARTALLAAAEMERALGEFSSFTELEWGDWYSRAGDRDKTLEHYQRAVTLANEAIERRPEEMQLRRQLADCYERLGGFHTEAHDPSTAQQYYEKSLDVWTNWTKWGVSSTYNLQREKATRAMLQRLESTVSRSR